jgi:hypothetical protein
MVKAGGKEGNYASVAGVGVKRDSRVRIADGGGGSGSRVRVRGTREGARRSTWSVALSTLEKNLLEAAGKVSGNKWGNGQRASNGRASVE